MKTLYLTWILIVGFALNSCKEDKRHIYINQVKALSKLATTEFTVSKIIAARKEAKIVFVPLKTATFIGKSTAIIKAGINLQLIQPEDVVIDGKSISLELPPVEIISINFPVEHFNQIDEYTDTKTFLNEINAEDIDTMLKQAQLDIESTVNEINFRSIIEKNTRSLLECFLKTLGFNEIYINYKPVQLQG